MRTMKTLLTAQITPAIPLWADALPFITFAYNASLHSSTGEIPFFLWFSRLPNPVRHYANEDVEVDASSASSPTTLLRLCDAIQAVRETVKDTLNSTDSQRLLAATATIWKVGDFCWLYEPQLSQLTHSRKFVCPWSGPFVILSVNDNKAVTILYPTPTNARAQLLVNVDRLRPYF